MNRKLKLTYDDGQPVDNREVAIYKGDRRVESKTDDRGRCVFDWPHDWADRLEVEQQVVKRDWDLGGGWSGPKDDLGELTVARPGENRPDSVPHGLIDSESDEQGIRGLLFYPDGTLAFEIFHIEAEFSSFDSPRYSSRERGSYCKTNGEFFIATGEYRRGRVLAKVYVNGNEVPRGSFQRGEGGSYVVVVPAGSGRGKGSNGGLVTGRVVDGDGAPAGRCKISAEVRSSSFIPFSGETATTYSDNHGRFQLPFTGGVVIKKLYVGGSEPSRILKGKGENAQELANRDLPAGTFNITLVRQKKAFLGLF